MKKLTRCQCFILKHFNLSKFFLDPAAQAIIGYASALCPLIAYNREDQKTSEISPKFERYTDYKFDTGEKLRVKQRGNGINGAFLKMDVLVNGDTPHSEYLVNSYCY